MSTRLLALGVLLTAAGCASTTVRSGRPPSDSAAGYSERWHPAFLFGMIPGRDPYEMAQVCPNGWAQVTVTRDPFTLLASVITLFIYSPSRVTIVCASPQVPGLPPVQGYTPNARNMPSPPDGL